MNTIRGIDRSKLSFQFDSEIEELITSAKSENTAIDTVDCTLFYDEEMIAGVTMSDCGSYELSWYKDGFKAYEPEINEYLDSLPENSYEVESF